MARVVFITTILLAVFIGLPLFALCFSGGGAQLKFEWRRNKNHLPAESRWALFCNHRGRFGFDLVRRDFHQGPEYATTKTGWKLDVGPGANLAIEPTLLHYLGFVCQRVDFNDRNFASSGLILAIPNWLFFGVMLAAPIWIGVHRRRLRIIRNRRLRGLCIYCGYDVRASPTRCPECGGPAGLAGSAASTDR